MKLLFGRDFPFPRGERVTVRSAISSWASWVTWLRRDSRDLAPSADGPMTFDDFVGMLYWRDILQRGFDHLRIGADRPEWRPVWAIDALFNCLTVPDRLDVMPALETDMFERSEAAAWWKRRVPFSGAIGFEFSATVRCGRQMLDSFDAHVRKNADAPDVRPTPPRRYPRLGASDLTATGTTFDELLVLWADRLLQLKAEVETPAALGGDMRCEDYFELMSIEAALHRAYRRRKFATGSDEWFIVTALESLFQHLTVPDDQGLLLVLAPQLFATYEDEPPREIRLPVDGSIGFEIAAAARRVRGVWSPLDGRCGAPEPGAG